MSIRNLIISPTPSNTATNTPTLTPTSTVCPGLTPTATLTATITSTRTPTPSITATLTPSTSPCINCYEYSFTASTSGLLTWLDCDGVMSDTFVNSGDTYQITCIGAREGTVSGTGTIVRGSLCSSTCITPTLTRTPTSTPTNTNTSTNTGTPTSTPTMTMTPDLSPNITPTSTQTPSVTPTNTSTPTVTTTQTPSPSETGSGGQLFIYARLINTGQEVGYTVNGGIYLGIGEPTSECNFLATISGLQIGDQVDFQTISQCAIGGDLSTCPASTTGCNYQHIFNGTTYIYLTIDASNCC